MASHLERNILFYWNFLTGFNFKIASFIFNLAIYMCVCLLKISAAGDDTFYTCSGKKVT